MSTQARHPSAEALRAAFDATFAAPPAGERPAVEDFLALRIGGDGYAARLLDAKGLVAGCRPVPLPSPQPELFGLFAIRGAIVPVYGASLLLGYPRPALDAYWLLLCGEDDGRVALAFEEFDGFFQAGREDVCEVPADEGRPHAHVVATVTHREAVRSVVSIASLLGAIRRGVEATRTR